MKMMQKDNHESRGYGFGTYNEIDTAASAIRNLNKTNINNREIRVDFADDASNGTNLKKEEVSGRDRAEIISKIGGKSSASVCNKESLKP